MLNLSDKDLDRLSREAAEEHEPGDIGGPRSWDKLEIRLDRELGRMSLNSPRGLRGFRRLPFYFAPAALLLLGISYYFFRSNQQKGVSSGSPPLSLIRPAPAGAADTSTGTFSATQNQEHSDKSTSTPANPSTTTEYPAASAGGHAAAPALPGSESNEASGMVAGSAATVPGINGSSRRMDAAGSANTYGGTHTKRQNHQGNRASASSSGASPIGARTSSIGAQTSSIGGQAPSSGNQPSSGRNYTSSAGKLASASAAANELTRSTVRQPHSDKPRIIISDSALLAFNANGGPIHATPGKGGLHINRPLQFGLVAAPDFSSVNSQAGDKAGSTIGLTVDYRFAGRWYLGTGLLFSRKNYAATPQDYHVPKDYYQNNNLNNVDFVKGTFNMLEIPLNLRYDFSVTGSTLFFAKAGISSYLRTDENCNYYYDWFGSQYAKGFKYSNQPAYLFSALTLSLGVETGLSNNLSLLIAPYIKMPVRNIGFGQVELNSVGIDFALKFTPVLSRKRH